MLDYYFLLSCILFLFLWGSSVYVNTGIALTVVNVAKLEKERQMWRITTLVQSSSFLPMEVPFKFGSVLMPSQLSLDSCWCQAPHPKNWATPSHECICQHTGIGRIYYTSNSHSIFFPLAIHNNSIKEAARDMLILQHIFCFHWFCRLICNLIMLPALLWFIITCWHWIHISICIKCFNMIKNVINISNKVVFYCFFILGSASSRLSLITNGGGLFSL